MAMTFDIVALGESTVDLISDEKVASLEDARYFGLYRGGQVANLAINMANLGCRVALATCLGDDGFGEFIRQEISDYGIGLQYVQTAKNTPTTMSIITRNTATPDFVIYRGADANLVLTDSLLASVEHCRVVHTSAFALSRDPARTTILTLLKKAQQMGKWVSLDPNYHPSIWPDLPDFISVLKEAFRFVSITKPSLDDCTRLFGPRSSPEEYARLFFEWGAQIVMITMGKDGVLLRTSDGRLHHIQAATNIPVVDVTGAGDAYWAGFLAGFLESEDSLLAARIGQKMAEKKIGRVGPINESLEWETIVESAAQIPCSEVVIERR